MKSSKLRTKGALGNRLELNNLFKDTNGLRQGIKEFLISGQNPIQLNFQLVKRNKNMKPGGHGGTLQ